MNDDEHVKCWMVYAWMIDWYGLLPLCIWTIMLRNMFYVFEYHASALYVCVCSWFMGLDARMICWCIVASSSSVRGSRTLQCGIRALVAAWAWMGHDRSNSRCRFPSTQQQSEIVAGKLENFSKCWNYWSIEILSDKIFRCSRHLMGSPLDGWWPKKIWNFFLRLTIGDRRKIVVLIVDG